MAPALRPGQLINIVMGFSPTQNKFHKSSFVAELRSILEMNIFHNQYFHAMRTTIIFLLCSLFTTSIKAQQTEIKGPRSWETVSPLLGKSISQAMPVFLKAGLKEIQQTKETATGMDLYSFYPRNVLYKTEEPLNRVGCKDKKIVYIIVEYNYRKWEEDSKSILESDIAEMKKSMGGSGFIFEKEKNDGEFIYYIYQSGNKSSSAVIAVQICCKQFSLIIGEPEIVKNEIKQGIHYNQ